MEVNIIQGLYEEANRIAEQRDRLMVALDDAAKSLQRIAHDAGINEYLKEMQQVRGYAGRLAQVTFEILDDVRE